MCVFLFRERLDPLKEDLDIHLIHHGDHIVDVTERKAFNEWAIDYFNPATWMEESKREFSAAVEAKLQCKIAEAKAKFKQLAKVRQHGGVTFGREKTRVEMTVLKFEHEVEKDVNIAGMGQVHWMLHLECRWQATIPYSMYSM